MKTHCIQKAAIILSLAYIFLFTIPVNAQIIMIDGYSGSRIEEEEAPFVPILGVTYDQYAPLSGGILLLSVFAASYGFSKRKKNT